MITLASEVAFSSRFFFLPLKRFQVRLGPARVGHNLSRFYCENGVFLVLFHNTVLNIV